MAALSPEAIDMLEFALGPKAKRGRGDPNAHRAGKAVAGLGFAPIAGVAGGFSVFGKGTHKQRSANAVAALQRTVAKSPEVMVKVTGRQNGSGHVAANFAYISRLGYGDDKELELVTSEGKELNTWHEMKELADQWQAWEMNDEARRKGSTSLSMVLSMPAGTDASKVLQAAKAFAQSEMADRRWVMALHNDKDHPHVHLTVARRDLDGLRFHPGNEDLFRYRQAFAEKLRDVGIEANATPRKARGVSVKAEATPVYQIAKRGGKSQIAERVKADTVASFIEGKQHTAYDAYLKEQRNEVGAAFRKVSEELVQNPDRQYKDLALAVANFYKDMPTAQSLQSRRVAQMRDRQQQSKDRPNYKAQAKETPGRSERDR